MTLKKVYLSMYWLKKHKKRHPIMLSHYQMFLFIQLLLSYLYYYNIQVVCNSTTFLLNFLLTFFLNQQICVMPMSSHFLFIFYIHLHILSRPILKFLFWKCRTFKINFIFMLKGRKEIQSVSRKHIEKQVFQFSANKKNMQRKYRVPTSVYYSVFGLLHYILICFLPTFQRLFIISSLILFIESVTYFVACSS